VLRALAISCGGLTRVSGRALLGLFPLAAAIVSAGAACPQATPPPRHAIDLQRLADKLGSGRYAEREAATRILEATESARGIIERLARSGDEEVATRARRILAEHDRVYAATRINRYFEYGRRGQIERMVEGLARWNGPIDNEEFWREARSVAVAVADRVDRHQNLNALNDFLQTTKRAKVEPNLVRVTNSWFGRMQDGGYLSVDAAVRAYHLANVMAFSTGKVSVTGGTAAGMLFTTEEFESGSDANSRVASFFIFSADRAVLRGKVSDAIIIAREGIDATNCTTVSHCLLATSGKVVGADKSDTRRRLTIDEGKASPLGFVQWFGSSTIGFETDASTGGFKVTSIAAKSVADLAGLRVGDVITHIDGAQAKYAVEGFRKQLRRGSVQDNCELTVARNGFQEIITLDFTADNKK
jgi:hypothetical protein